MASNTDTPAIILVEPQLGENIGTAARAMANFGLDRLRLVAPRDGWPNDRARAAASGADHVIDAVELYATVEEAVGDLSFLYATTARPRDLVKPVMSPEAGVKEMMSVIAGGQNCGILFGRERFGLNNDEISLANALIMAPVNPDFASINLAQSVLLLGYEWRKAANSVSLGRKTDFDGPGEAGTNMRRSWPASKNDLIMFYEHLEAELDRSGFLRPVEKRPTMVRNIRNMFERMGASEQEVRTLRGIVASLTRTHKHSDNAP